MSAMYFGHHYQITARLISHSWEVSLAYHLWWKETPALLGSGTGGRSVADPGPACFLA